MATIDQFTAEYEAKLGSFPGDDTTMHLWESFASRIPPDMISTLMDAVTESHSATRMVRLPRLGQFYATWKRIRPTRRNDRQWEPCGLCGGSGWIEYLSSRYVDDDERNRIALADASKGPLHFRCTQCVCSQGEKMAMATKDSWPLEDRKRVAEWMGVQATEAAGNGFASAFQYHKHLISQSREAWEHGEHQTVGHEDNQGDAIYPERV